MFRPTKLLPSWFLAAVLLVLALWSRGQEPAGTQPPSGSEVLPEAPAGGLLDGGNVFNAEEKVLVSVELEDFRQRVGLPAFVVTANYVFGNTVDQYGERLVMEWSKGNPGVVLLYERGSGQLNYSATPGALGRMEDMKALFLSASRASAMMPGDATAAQHLRAALHGLTLSAETWKKTGTLPEVNSLPPAVDSPATSIQNEGAMPAAPVDFVIDDADAFDPGTEAALKTELATFHSKYDADIYVATCTILPDTSAQLWAERLAQEWLQGRRGAVLVMNRGTGPAEHPLGIAGSTPNEQLLTSAALFKAIEESKLKARDAETAPQGSLANGIRAAANHLMQVFAARGDSAQTPSESSGLWRVITSLAAALVLGSALLFIFHRFQERLERRSREQFLFPDVSVGCRLGALQSGGEVAGISFAKGPRS